MVGVWEGLNLGSIPKIFLCFWIHPKIIDVYPKLIPKGGVVQFCHTYSFKCECPRQLPMTLLVNILFTQQLAVNVSLSLSAK